jgi:hypothetical protein
MSRRTADMPLFIVVFLAIVAILGSCVYGGGSSMTAEERARQNY